MKLEDFEGAIHAEHAGDPIQPLHVAKAKTNGRAPKSRPVALEVADLLNLEAPERKMLIETALSTPGLITLIGAQKSGKTVLAIQMAIAVASGHALMNNWRVIDRGSVLVVEQDDTAGALSLRDYLRASPVPVKGLPIYTFTRIGFGFGVDFYSWIEGEIMGRKALLVVLDSYTALRPHRRGAGDIVKIESDEMALLDDIAKRTGCTILLLHHVSKGRADMDWSNQGAGTYGLGQAVEGMIHIARFKDFSGSAPERLLMGRGRHLGDLEAVIRFRKSTLDYEMVLEGSGAPMWPEIVQLRTEFDDRAFSQKELYQGLGMSRTSAYRLVTRLASAGVITRHGYGEYRLAAEALSAFKIGTVA